MDVNFIYKFAYTLLLLGVSCFALPENTQMNDPSTIIESWGKTIQQAAFVKDGLERFRNPQYQYECLGLRGTVMRVGRDGFTVPGACARITKGGLKHLSYLSYQYWWDEEAHPHLPFDLIGDRHYVNQMSIDGAQLVRGEFRFKTV